MSDDMSDSNTKEESNPPFEESTERSSSSSVDDETMSKLTMTGAEDVSSSLTENEMSSHILQRGALISGVVPSRDEEECSPPSVNANDLESGINPPDSDYASRAPTNLWAPSIGEDSLTSGIYPPDSDYASRAPKCLWAPNDSIQSPSNISGYDDQSTLTKRSKAFRFIGLCFISLMLIGAIIAVAMIVVGGGGDNESRANGAVTTGSGSDNTGSNGGGIDTGGNGGNTGNGDGIDTGSNGGVVDIGSDSGGVDTETEPEPVADDPPPAEAPLTDRQQLMHDIIMGVSGDALQDFASPQSQARRWLLFEDILWLSPISSFKIERIIQRYALATFYFSTDGPNSWKDNNWMDSDECSGDFWDGISCNENDEIRAIAFGKSRREGLSNISNLYSFANTTHYSFACDR
jgi:hypothetical protein